MIDERTLMMVKSPFCLRVNFKLTIDHFRFLVFSQTLSLLAKGVNPQLFHKDITWWASLCAARDSSHVVTRDLRWDSTAGMEELEMTKGRV